MSQFADDMRSLRHTRRSHKKEHQPKRMQIAIDALKAKGIEITTQTETEIQFWFKHEIIKFFPYTGWATGKSIKDGRGLQNLLKQL